jgi:cytochrome c oxidase assembly protein subunit 15
LNAAYKPGLHRYAVCTAIATFLLLVAGALVTSNDAGLAVPDWPLSYGSYFPPMVGGIFYEHGHRMVATFVGYLTIGLSIALLVAEPRGWVRRLGLVALAAVVAQGILGYLTVKFLLPPPISIAHASLAQIFFCITVALAIFTSRWWLSELPQVEDTGSPRLQTLAAAAVGATFLQLVLGAAFRHNAFGIVPHLIGAAVVLLLVILAGRAVRIRFPGARPLRRAGALLHALVGTQILLGAAAWWSRLASRGMQQIPDSTIWLTVVHTVFGALVLAATVVLALAAHRVVRSPEAEAEEGGDELEFVGAPVSKGPRNLAASARTPLSGGGAQS